VLSSLAQLDGDRPAGVIDLVPGYTTLLVLYDPGLADPAELRGWVERRLESPPAERHAPPAQPVVIPVLYDPIVAADLQALASEKGLTVDELVTIHTGAIYRCYILGFRPGFPFLGGLDPRLHTPRLATPRVRVPAGSVGIGGQQTGVYPVESPGGWRIIGRTPLRLFDPDRADPFLVHPGDRVVFAAIDPSGFKALGGNP
jgi:inhibitor of KinA